MKFTSACFISLILSSNLSNLLGGSSNVRTDYKIWTSKPNGNGIRYFEEVSNTEWIEATEDGKTIDRFEFIEHNNKDDVILKRIGTSYYLELCSGNAKWGTDRYTFRNLVSKGAWLCSDCRLPSKTQNDNYYFNHFNYTIINDMPYDFDLTWIDYNGQTDSSPFVTLGSGTFAFQYSFLNNRWLLTSEHGDDVEFQLGHGYFRKTNGAVKISTILK